MTNEQLAVYLEQLTINLAKLLNDAQNQLNEVGIEHETTRVYETPNSDSIAVFRIGQPVSFKNVETPNIVALQPLFDFISDLQNTITILDPKRDITNDNR